MPSHRPDVLVVGGGVIGLSAAWEAVRRGLEVVVLERAEPGSGASAVAAGMLAPAAEAQWGEAGRRLLELGRRSAALWPEFAAALEEQSATAVGLRRTGTLLVARDRDEAEALEHERVLRPEARRLRGGEARELEPALAPSVRMALELDEPSVDPRRVCAALAATLGGRVRRAEVVEVEPSAVRLADGERLQAETVVLAAGAWSAALGVPAVRPVKGQILRLRDPAGPGLLERTVRYDGGYVVPRGDGRYVVGATMEEQGFDVRPTAGAVRELLREAWELLPGLDEAELEEVGVGLRPATPDNLPLVGRDERGVLLATGHFRNGVLLAPLTAALVAEELRGAAVAA